MTYNNRTIKGKYKNARILIAVYKLLWLLKYIYILLWVLSIMCLMPEEGQYNQNMYPVSMGPIKLLCIL